MSCQCSNKVFGYVAKGFSFLAGLTLGAAAVMEFMKLKKKITFHQAIWYGYWM